MLATNEQVEPTIVQEDGRYYIPMSTLDFLGRTFAFSESTERENGFNFGISFKEHKRRSTLLVKLDIFSNQEKKPVQ